MADARIDVWQHERRAPARCLIRRAAFDTDQSASGEHALRQYLRKGNAQLLAPALLDNSVDHVAQDGSPPVN
eukprot:11254718-Alexandrium_andersonii.AAC.1